LVQNGPPRKILEQPASVDVARLLGVFNLAPAEVLALDPGRNTSRLRVGEYELQGPYLPGHLIGDRVHVAMRPDALRAMPRSGRLGPNQIPAELLRVIEKPHAIRLEFAGDMAVEVPGQSFNGQTQSGEWVIEV